LAPFLEEMYWSHRRISMSARNLGLPRWVAFCSLFLGCLAPALELGAFGPPLSFPPPPETNAESRPPAGFPGPNSEKTSDTETARPTGTGAISGTVTDDQGTPIEGVYVEVWEGPLFEHVTTVATNSMGQYTTGPMLESGDYGLVAYNSGAGVRSWLVDQMYDGIQCGYCVAEDATLVAVADGVTTTGIDFVLQHGGKIAGTVLDAATMNPLDHAGVSALDSCALGGSHTYTIADPDGSYEITNLPPGEYYLTAAGGYSPDEPRLKVIWPAVACPPNDCDPRSGTPVTVTVDQTTENIDFALTEGAVLKGTTVPGPNVSLYLYDADRNRANHVAVSSSPDDGSFRFDYNIRGGTYYLAVSAFDYIDEIYEGIVIPRYSRDWDPASGTPIELTEGSVVDIGYWALQRGGGVSGRVTDAVSGDPVEGTLVVIYDQCGHSVGSNTTGVDGSYSAPHSPWVRLPGGVYYVAATPSSTHRGRVYGGPPCNDECQPTWGTPITVVPGTIIPGIDIDVESLPTSASGSISGTVIATVGGQPLEGIAVGIKRVGEEGTIWTSTLTDAAGHFSVGFLSPGEYWVVVDDWAYELPFEEAPYMGELYDDIPCAWECDRSAGTPVTVTGGADAVADFALDRAGVLTGHVVDAVTGCATMAGIENCTTCTQVGVYDDQGELATDFAWADYSNAQGGSGRYFTLSGVVAGDYYLLTEDALHYVDGGPGGLVCPFGDCDPTSGPVVTAVAGNIVEAPDIALQKGGMPTGILTRSDTGQPLALETVEIFNAAGELLETRRTGGTDAAIYQLWYGRYTPELGYPSGDYYVRTRNDRGLVDELYDDIPCPGGACDPTTGTPIAVTIGEVTDGVDLALDPGGLIAGEVRDSSNGLVLSEATVRIYDAQGTLMMEFESDGCGYLAPTGLLSGTYFAVASMYGYAPVLYDGISCRAGCDPTTGTPIAVTLPVTTTGIDFDLEPGFLFADGFEFDGLSRWSATSP